jgi:hypothetical protein
MSDTTSILDLPTNPIVGGNISLKATEPSLPIQPPNTSQPLDQTTITQLVNGLQQASVNGATQLQSRDIPINTNNISYDAQIQPNFIPTPNDQLNQDYISAYDQQPKHSSQHVNVNNNSLDELYNEIQLPILIGVMYFLFQLPFFNKKLYTYFPILFSNDGNLNLNGFLFKSILFGSLYYLLNKVICYF